MKWSRVNFYKRLLLVLIVLTVIITTTSIIDEKYNVAYGDNVEVNNLGEHQGEVYSIPGINPSFEGAINIDQEGLGSFVNVKYIDNANYFLANPQHADNDGDDNIAGTCTTVAMQLLLGYHNYYTDRRLLAPEYLETDYGDYLEQPDLDPSTTFGLGRGSIGTKDELYDMLLMLNPVYDVPAIGQNIYSVAEAAEDLVAMNTAIDYETVSIECDVYNQNDTINDINSGNPVVVALTPFGEGSDSFHVVVAYGYASCGDEFGYITHFGWYSDDVNVWIPETWVGFQVRMGINHEHNLIDTYNDFDISFDTIDNIYREIYCDECGYSYIDNLYEVNSVGDTIVSVNYGLASNITVPHSVNQNPISSIGDGLFANNHNIETVVVPRGIYYIGDNAFANCVNLTSVTMQNVISIGERSFSGCANLSSIHIPHTTQSIGEMAFVGCGDFTITVAPGNQNYTAQDNILYNKQQTQVIAAGNVLSGITIPATITSISPYAFAGNTNLTAVRFLTNSTIGNNAFENCNNLTTIHFDTTYVPTVGNDVFKGDNLLICVPYIKQAEYKAAFDQYVGRITSIPVKLTYVDNGSVVHVESTYDGNYISAAPSVSKEGYEFGGWYDNPEYSGEAYENGDFLESETDLYLYAKWIPPQYTVTLDANGGTLQGNNSVTVFYGQAFSTSTTVSRTGYTFEGWYDTNNVKYITEQGQSTVLWDKTEDTTLYARWAIERYEIQINDNGSIVWLGASGLSDTSCTIEYGAVLSAINLVPIYKVSNHGYKEGKIFDHFEYGNTVADWTTIPDFGDNGDIVTIIPVWVLERHTISLHTQCDIVAQSIVAEYGNEIVLPVLTRVGYTLEGWYENANFNQKINWNTMPDLTVGEQCNGSTDLYAKWTANTYTISYNKMGGVGVMSSSIHTYDISQKLNKNTFTKVGHDFVGWSIVANGAVVYGDQESVVNLSAENLSTVYLYAVWQPKVYSIIYENLMPDMAVYPTSYTYGVGMDTMPSIYLVGSSGSSLLPSEHFYGWYTSESFTTEVTSISKTQTGNITLYAKYDYKLAGITSNITETVTDDSISGQPYFEVSIQLGSYYYDLVKETTMSKIRINISLSMWELNDGYQQLYLYAEGNQVWSKEEEHGGTGKDSTAQSKSYEIKLDIEQYKDVDWLTLRFHASGAFEDDWQFNNFAMEVCFVN